MRPMKLRDTRNQLTAFALSCGYVERFGDLFTFGRQQGIYYIRGITPEGTRIDRSWTAFGPARKDWRQLCAAYQGEK